MSKVSGGFLDSIKRAYGLDTDYQLMQFMGWTSQSRITHYRKRGEFDEDTCLEVAAKLHLDPMHVLASVAAARTDSKIARAAWLALAESTRKHVAKVATPIMLATFLSASAINGLSPTTGGAPVNMLYIM